MALVNARSTFGHAAASLERTRAALGIPRPASLRQMADLYARDLVFDEPIVTADGVALGGHHALTVRHDGSYKYRGHVRATGWPSYEVSILTTLGYDIPVPGSSAAFSQVAFTAHGEVHGSNEPGDREYAWDKEGKSLLLASEWEGVRRSKLHRQLEYDVDWFGSAGDVVSFVGQLVLLAPLGAAGVAIVIAGATTDLEQLVLPGMVGIIMAGGAAFILGPGALLPGFIIGAAVTAALVKQRHLTDEEKAFANQVFGGTLPLDRVLLTNLVGLGDRPFTTPAPGGAILVNLGEGYNDPVRYTGKGGTLLNQNAAGQLLIHELTHAWQIGNESFTPEYYCRAVSTAASTAGGDMSAYDYGPAGASWGSFGTEQQASIVDQWFAGKKMPARRDKVDRQRPYNQMDANDQGPDQNPYYRYIRDNIRTGIA